MYPGMPGMGSGMRPMQMGQPVMNPHMMSMGGGQMPGMGSFSSQMMPMGNQMGIPQMPGMAPGAMPAMGAPMSSGMRPQMANPMMGGMGQGMGACHPQMGGQMQTLQPMGMQPMGMQSMMQANAGGMQPMGAQHGMQANVGAMQPAGMQSVGMQPMGMQPMMQTAMAPAGNGVSCGMTPQGTMACIGDTSMQQNPMMQNSIGLHAVGGAAPHQMAMSQPQATMEANARQAQAAQAQPQPLASIPQFPVPQAHPAGQGQAAQSVSFGGAIKPISNIPGAQSVSDQSTGLARLTPNSGLADAIGQSGADTTPPTMGTFPGLNGASQMPRFAGQIQ